MRFINPKIIGILALLVVLWVVLIVAVPETFLKGGNLEKLMRRTALYGVLGIGVAFVIITSGIDLSIGSIVCLSASLLALFLNVAYQPFDVQHVLAVQAKQQTIVLSGEIESFAVDDVIRYEGGRRARKAVLTVTGVESIQFTTEDGASVQATALRLDKPLSRDDTMGYVAKLSSVVAFDVGDKEADIPSTVTIAGDHGHIEARDKLVLIHPTSGRQNLAVDSVSVTDNQTKVTTREELGSTVNAEWLSMPFERHQRMSVLMAILLVLAIGLGLGVIHGLLITKVELQPFVVTLCGLLIYRGVARYLTDDQVQGFGTEYTDSVQGLVALGKWDLGISSYGEALAIPFPFFILIITGVIASVFLNKTIWGRYMQALGHNEPAARYSGINTHLITILAYIICAMLAAVGGMLFAMDSNSVSPSAFGNFFELYAIAAAVLGGCSLRGGEGGILGVVIGTAVMQTLKNSIQLLGISDKLEYVIVGGVLLAGVIADQYIKRAVDRRRAATKSAESKSPSSPD
jgi:ribose transport system permease protein